MAAKLLETEVAIIGAGPAGLAAALTLSRYTRRSVSVLDYQPHPRPRSGETVSAAISPLLAYLGVECGNAKELSIASYSFASSWGSSAPLIREAITHMGGSGYIIDGHELSSLLASNLINTRVRLLSGAKFCFGRWTNNCWHLVIRQNGSEELIIRTKQVIDATGRSSLFAKRLGVRRLTRDRLLAISARFLRCPPMPQPYSVLVESVSNGWWYNAFTTSSTAIAIFLTDIDLSGITLKHMTNFSRTMRQAPHTSAMLGSYDICTTPRLCLAESSLLSSCFGPGWIAAGDAAAAFDPISSLGVGHAITSGIEAARATDARLQGHEEAAASYERQVYDNFRSFEQRVSETYQAELRWKNAAFWRRRQNVAALKL